MQAKHYFWLSTAAAVATICLKTLAWQMTGSIGLASDAMESFVNLAGAAFALWMITIVKVPPDDEHPLGHSKAEYFSSGFEGLLIFGAAGAIIWSATARLFAPAPRVAYEHRADLEQLRSERGCLRKPRVRSQYRPPILNAVTRLSNHVRVALGCVRVIVAPARWAAADKV